MKKKKPEVLFDPECITPILTLAAINNPDNPEEAVAAALADEEDRVRRTVMEAFRMCSEDTSDDET
jgi:hypothetical protein